MYLADVYMTGGIGVVYKLMCGINETEIVYPKNYFKDPELDAARFLSQYWVVFQRIPVFREFVLSIE